MRKKEMIISILVIINICIIGIWIFNIVQNQLYQRKYIRELFSKNANCQNYIITINQTFYFSNEEQNYQEKIIYKDNISKKEKNGEITWEIENKIILEEIETIYLYDSILASIEEPLMYMSGLFQYIDNTNIKYSFVGKEEYNNNTCLIIDFDSQSNYENQVKKYRCWIDQKSGIVYKEEEYDKDLKLITRSEFDVEINCVTDKDLILPNIDEYKIIVKQED